WRLCRSYQIRDGIWPSNLRILVFLTIPTHHSEAVCRGFIRDGIWPSNLRILVFLTIPTHHSEAVCRGFGDATFIVGLHSPWRPDICGNLSISHSAAVSKVTARPIRRFWTAIRAKIRATADLQRSVTVTGR